MGSDRLNGNVGVAGCSSQDGKRKRGEHRKRSVAGGSASGDYLGVRNRGVIMNFNNWYEGENFNKDVKMSEEEAALVHDLARLYVNVKHDRLNVQKLEVRIQAEDPVLAGYGMLLDIGKSFLIYFVEELHPLAPVGENSKERADWMKEKIVELAPAAFKGLKDAILKSHISREGRQRKEIVEIPPPVLEDNPLQELQKEKQDLIRAKDAAIEEKVAVIASLKEAEEAKDAALKARDAALVARDTAMDDLKAANARAASVTPFKLGFIEREVFYQNKEIQDLKAILRSKESEIECLKKEKDNALEARDTTLKEKNAAREMQELYAG